MQYSCKLISGESRAHLFAARNGLTMVFCLSGMVQEGTPFLDLATSRIGSSRTHGESIGERRDITGFAGDMVCVA